jgi:hypothetical protein
LPGTGTVTSVDMSVPSPLVISGNPVTTFGTLAVALPNANLDWAAKAPLAAAASQAGRRAAIIGSDATAGTSVNGAAAGGDAYMVGGNAAQHNSGQAKGGNIHFAPGIPLLIPGSFSRSMVQVLFPLLQ